jgi:2-oxo-4-hydroxy-4-carboxy-5-ureidoimidazoline decarboxylase
MCDEVFFYGQEWHACLALRQPEGIISLEMLGDLNDGNEDRAIALLEPLIERAPQIAAKVARHRPFKNAEDLCHAIQRELRDLNAEDCIRLFRAHPELSPDNPLSMTRASQSEQGRFNLTSAQNAYQGRLAALNAEYCRKFGFPFITALVRHQDMDSVLREFEARIASDLDAEIKQTLEQVFWVSSARVEAAFNAKITDMSQYTTAR